MNIVFTCGGTGGHIYPAIAVARMFRERQPDCKILFIGAEDGMENKIVPREGFRLETVKISNYQRRLTPAAIWHNLVTVQRMAATFSKTKRILKDFQPDVIVGTGGYASFPALKMGAKLGIPTCVHESNAVPGLTTKLVARTASRVMVSFESSREHYPEPEKVLLTGTPVREEFLFAKRQEARQALGLGDEPLVVSGPEVRAVLENAGVSEEKLAGFQVKFEETFGDDAALSPRNLVDSKRMQLKTPDVIIHVAPDRGDLVETRTLGGVKYIMVRAEDGVELNGVDIQIDGN